jgi:phosphate transport system substrate-binding protein
MLRLLHRFVPVVLLALVVGCGGEPVKPNAGSSKANAGGDKEPVEGTESDNAGGGNSAAAGAKTITSDGSSTVFPVTEAVAEEFMNEKKGVRVTVGISGTGGGFKKFVRGELDIADASRPILEKEMASAKEAGIEYIELPVCFDALTVAVSRQNDWVDSISVEELKRIWEPDAQDKITKWSDIRPEWPDAKIVLYGAGSDSGTFDYFTEAVVGKSKSSRTDFTASEDDNILVKGIAGDKHALGYLPFAYYETNKDKLKAVAITAGEGKQGVLPTLENVLNATYTPLSRPLFIYVNKKSAERAEVKDFVHFYLDNVTELAKEVHYLPLQAKAYEMARERFDKRLAGSAFGGKPEVGVHVEEILKREPKP